ncbi:Uncharacterised protein [Serratia marcescens]|nr:Uncharacterised protein [Serratia marcescens]
MTKRQHGFNLRHRAVLQHQLRQGAERHFLAVIQVVALLQHGKTVVNGVRRRQPTALEADAAQIGIGLNDAFHRFRHHAGLDRQFGFHPFRQQRVITQPRQAERRQRRFAAGHAGGLGVEAGLRLEIGGERVAHAGHQQTHRRFGDDGAVHHHHVRVARVNQVLGEFALFGVENRQRAGRRIGGGDGGNEHHRQLLVVRHGLGGVERLAAADADHAAAAVSLQLMAEPVYLLAAAFAVEAGRMMFHAVLLQAAH